MTTATPATPPTTPTNILAVFYADPLGDHTVIKLRPRDPGKPEFAAHLVNRLLTPGDSGDWLARRGWFGGEIRQITDRLWTITATRDAWAIRDDDEAVQALARVRADIAYDPWSAAAQHLIEYLAERGEPQARELAQLIERLRGADDDTDLDTGD
jgi:hypothetical protein